MRLLPVVALAAATPALAETIKITATSDKKFDPETATAEKGDVLEFHFESGNHSVAMGSFEETVNGPCVPSNEGGFFSGYFDVKEGTSDEVFRVTVNDTEPMVFYSTQGKECPEGMIGAINADAKDLETYRDEASGIASGVAPREPFGGEIAKAGSDSGSGSDDGDDGGSSGGGDGDGDEGGAVETRAYVIGALGAAGLVAALML